MRIRTSRRRRSDRQHQNDHAENTHKAPHVSRNAGWGPPAHSITPWVVIYSVARQIAATSPVAKVVESQHAAAARRHEPLVEVDQVAVVRRRALGAADAVRIVTDRARRAGSR